MANIPVELKDVGQSGLRLRDELAKIRFNPLRVHPLQYYAHVEFRNEWLGLSDALRFEKH